ncbi:MAG: TatD family hydrolase [bacterium]|nr:TatD family hydrolase [bacterium]
MRFFDVHTHTQFAAFRDDAPAVIERALENNISLINVGTQKDTSSAAIELAKKYAEGIYASVGLHPIHTEKSYHDEKELGAAPSGGEPRLDFTSRREEFDYDFYKKLAEGPKVIAIGECGLDYAVFARERGERLQKRASAEAFSEGGLPQERIAKQKEIFEKQIALSGEIKKPLMIHCRAAFSDLIEILRASSFKLQVPGIVHFFSGTKEDAKKLMDLGFSFSFGGVLTFTHDYDEVVRYVELDRILLETDAPYVAPVPYRGKRNEPTYVIEVAKKISELKDISLEKVADITFQNAQRIFLKKV